LARYLGYTLVQDAIWQVRGERLNLEKKLGGLLPFEICGDTFQTVSVSLETFSPGRRWKVHGIAPDGCRAGMFPGRQFRSGTALVGKLPGELMPFLAESGEKKNCSAAELIFAECRDLSGCGGRGPCRFRVGTTRQKLNQSGSAYRGQTMGTKKTCDPRID